MNNKKFFMIAGFFIIGIFLISGVYAVCCERLENSDGSAGAWCQNVDDVGECYTGNNDLTGERYKNALTSCEQASYCQVGTCINVLEGTCSPNTPQQVCNEKGGKWEMADMEDLPQCQLGCCLMGNQAAFVTQTECKQLSSIYSLETNYLQNIQNEFECIASATSDVKGACVFERSTGRTCLMTTQRKCSELKAAGSSVGVFEDFYGSDTDLEGIDSGSVEFHEGFLCSATELATECGPKGGTTCVEGRDEVFFLDTCGNLANIYDNSKLNNEDYWTRIQDPTCGDGKDSATCGACDYYSGSTCKAYERGADSRSPSYGENVCRSLDCGEFDTNMNGKIDSSEKDYQHGESWCGVQETVSEISIDSEEGIESNVDSSEQNIPGSRYIQYSCQNGEVIPEPCADFRNEVCVESSVESEKGEFSVGKCVPNLWQDCLNQTTQEDCEDAGSRYCDWNSGLGVCTPQFAPGFEFWNGEGGASETCGLASSLCAVEYEVNIFINEDKFSGWSSKRKIESCVENCFCIEGYKKGDYDLKKEWRESDNYNKFNSYDEWISSMENMCISLGDCGNKVNFVGEEGEIRDYVVVEFDKKGKGR